MALLENMMTKRRLGRLSDAWERLRGYVDADPSRALPGSDAEFLALKKEIGQALNVLHADFGSGPMNREAESAALRIRNFLSGVPTLESLQAILARDQAGIQKAWHSVFLTMAELAGAKLPKKNKVSYPRAHAVPMSGEPRFGRRRFGVTRALGAVFGFVISLGVFFLVLAIAFFFAEKSGIFGRTDVTGKWVPAANPFLSRLGGVWQDVQSWFASNAPGFYGPMKSYYLTHPEISVIAMVGVAGIFVGYLLFIRAK